MDFNAFLEFIGVDVVFLGTVTLLAGYIGLAMWNAAPLPPASDPDMRRITWGIGRRLASVSQQGALAASVLVISATVAGMIVNGLSDSFLDSRIAKELSQHPWSKTFLAGDEDILKKDALDAILKNLRGQPKIAAIFANGSDDDGVKALTQEALARVFGSGQQALISSLRYELLDVKTLRSLWLLSSLLALTALAAIVRRSTYRAGKSDGVLKWWIPGAMLILVAGLGEPAREWFSAPRSFPTVWLGFWALVMMALAFFTWRDGKRLTALSLWFAVLSITFLQLWSIQSDRYYKKLLYSYATILEPTPVVAASSSIGFVYTGVCDGSAAAGIPDTTFFVAASDEDNILRVYESGSGKLVSGRDFTTFLGTGGKEADIEGVTRLGDRLFWVTSHGTNKEGKSRPERRRLFATTASVNDRGVAVEPSGSAYKALVDDLGAAKTLKGLHIDRAANKRPDDEGLNIEGLATDPDGRELWLGLRSPLVEGRAMIIRIQNPEALVDSEKSAAVIAAPLFLDLDGQGIRSLEYAPGLRTYLVVAGPAGDEGPLRLYRWAWPSTSTTPVNEPAIIDLRPEGLFVRGGAEGNTVVHLVTDEGDVKIGGRGCKDLPHKQQRFRDVPLTLSAD